MLIFQLSVQLTIEIECRSMATFIVKRDSNGARYFIFISRIFLKCNLKRVYSGLWLVNKVMFHTMCIARSWMHNVVHAAWWMHASVEDAFSSSRGGESGVQGCTGPLKYQLIRKRLSEKSTEEHATKPKGCLGRSRELLHVLNTNKMATWQRRICMFSFSSDTWKQGTFTHAEFYKNFQNPKTCDSETEMLEKKASWEKKQNFHVQKKQTCTFPLGQYAKLKWIPRPPLGLVACTFVLFSDNLSLISWIETQKRYF